MMSEHKEELARQKEAVKEERLKDEMHQQSTKIEKLKKKLGEAQAHIYRMEDKLRDTKDHTSDFQQILPFIMQQGKSDNGLLVPIVKALTDNRGAHARSDSMDAHCQPRGTRHCRSVNESEIHSGYGTRQRSHCGSGDEGQGGYDKFQVGYDTRGPSHGGMRAKKRGRDDDRAPTKSNEDVSHISEWDKNMIKKELDGLDLGKHSCRVLIYPPPHNTHHTPHTTQHTPHTTHHTPHTTHHTPHTTYHTPRTTYHTLHTTHHTPHTTYHTPRTTYHRKRSITQTLVRVTLEIMFLVRF